MSKIMILGRLIEAVSARKELYLDIAKNEPENLLWQAEAQYWPELERILWAEYNAEAQR